MTDRLKGLTVTFKQDVREDDAEVYMEAIRLLRGVLRVDPIVSDHDTHIAESRVRHEIGEKLMKIVYPDWGSSK